jgi:hypothetical protein
MASDYTNSKEGLGAVFPDGAVDSSWQDAEPLLTPTQLRLRHMVGIPIVSAIKDPRTGKPTEVTDTELGELINEAVALAELESGLQIFSRRFEERHPYDQAEMQSYGYFRVRHAPACSVEKLAVTSTDGVNIWDVPLAWVETGNLHQGQINMIPFAVASLSGTTIPTIGPTGMGLLPGLFKQPWIPAMWKITYTTGFGKGLIPRIVNQLIGTVAAMEVLSMLAATYARATSSSLSMDGVSQSISTPGAELFVPRLNDLALKRKWLIKKLRHSVGLGIIVGNV